MRSIRGFVKRPLLLLPLVLLYTACSDDNEYVGGSLSSGKPDIHLSIEDAASSRTLISGTTASWVAGDRIGVFYGEESECIPFEVSIDAKGNAIAEFDDDLDWEKGDTFYAFYPYSDGIDIHEAFFTIPTEQTQSDAEATHLGETDIVVANPTKWSSDEITLHFYHAISLIDFTITNDYDSDMEIYGVEMTAPNEVFATEGYIDLTLDGNNADFAKILTTSRTETISITCDKGTSGWNRLESGATACIRMTIIPEDLSGEVIRVTFKTNIGDFDVVTEGKDFKAGVAYEFSKSLGWTGESSDVPNLTYFNFLASDNSGLYQDIIFEKQSDNSYAADVVYEVDLSSIIPSFDYPGSVIIEGQTVQSGKTSLNFPNEVIVRFDDKRVLFTVNRYYGIPTLYVETEGGASITSKTEYLACHLTLDCKNMWPDYESEGDLTDNIRGRGNSTWDYYDKKPYKLKLGSKESLVGIGSGKKYVLLANYRDPTNFMNAVTFDMARYMGMKYTNTNRFVELYLNGEYRGMYQLTEQIEQGTNRVGIDKTNGILFNVDEQDGPGGYTEKNAFSTSVYGLPVSVKHPEDLSTSELNTIKSDFATVENYIKNANYSSLGTVVDVESMIDFLIIQEVTRNVELVTPLSMYMFRDSDGIWTFGPVWDFDGGYAFNWGSMSTSHTYFISQSWLMGTKPAQAQYGTTYGAYNFLSGFWVNMFSSSSFVSAYKSQWNAVSSGMLAYAMEQLDDYVLHCADAMKRNDDRWPIYPTYETEIDNLRSWLTERFELYNSVVSAY